ncbi:MAG: ABC transporter ATP-binding protein, partial [Thermodesulfobacteriota bacterium]|nr:ABC transporter ATP-binding protein [Thermodesulfobacteriota bacterium]
MLEKLLGKEFKRVMAFMKPRMGQYVASLLIANIAADGFTIIEALALKLIMDAALSGQRASLVVGIVVVGVSVLAPIILIPVFGWIYQRCAHQTSAEIRLAVFSHICELPISYFDKNHSGDIVSRITSDASLLSNIYTFKLRRFVAPVIYGVCSAVVMLLLDGRIACALIVFNLISAYVNVRFGKPMRQVSDKVQQTIGNMTGMLIDFLAGFSIIRMFHIEQSVFGTYQETSYQVADYSISRYRLEGALDSTDFLLSAVSNLGTVIVGSYLVANGITEFGDLLALISLQAGLNRSLLQASYYLPQVQESMAGASRVLELLDAPTEPERYDLPQFETSCA